MSRMGYFSPGMIGALAGLVFAVFHSGDDGPAERLLLACVLVPALFAYCQLLMIAAQGIFAAVLPVPFGRSLRGTKCVVIGSLIVAAAVSGKLAYLFSRTESGQATLILGALSLVCALASLGWYVWSLPTAMMDFGEQDGV